MRFNTNAHWKKENSKVEPQTPLDRWPLIVLFLVLSSFNMTSRGRYGIHPAREHSVLQGPNTYKTCMLGHRCRGRTNCVCLDQCRAPRTPGLGAPWLDTNHSELSARLESMDGLTGLLSLSFSVDRPRAPPGLSPLPCIIPEKRAWPCISGHGRGAGAERTSSKLASSGRSID